MNVALVRNISKGLAPTNTSDVRTVIVNDEYGQPFVIIQELGVGKYIVAKSGDPDFTKIAKSLNLELSAKYTRANT